jgi:hypothetical protein
MNLPRVSPEVGQAIRAELEQTAGNEYVAKLLERLERENPCVAEFVSQMALQHEDPVTVSTAALLVYRLLESQSDADALKRDIKEP